MKVDIYRNLNIPKGRTEMWSVLDRSTRKVVDHIRTAVVDNVKVVVQPAGRARVIREERKNVHAFVRGELSDERLISSGLVRVSYNPYDHDHFIREDTGEAIYEADRVLMTLNGVWIGTPHR